MKLITKIIPIFALPLVLCSLSVAQSNVDLQVSVQLSSESARGGEPFSFTVQVNNRGSSKAADVSLLAWPDNQHFSITSVVTQRGMCTGETERSDSRWRCKIGDLSAGETISFTIAGKVSDIDEEISKGELPIDVTALREIDQAKARTAEAQARVLAAAEAASGKKITEQDIGTITLGTIWVSSDVEDKNPDDDSLSVRVQSLPNRNKPPQVAVANPKADAVLVRPAQKLTSFEFTIEAFDPDGEIEKVQVLDPKDAITPVPGAGRWEFLYHGAKYTAAELENFLRSNPQPETLARRSAKNTYLYTVTNPAWGRNRLSVTVTDNGGRTRSTYTDFNVRGDATVEIITPKKDEIVEPGSSLMVETVTTLNEGPIKEIFLVGDVQSETYRVPLELVSRKGNVYRHRYLLKNVQENSVYSSFHAVLVETSGAITESKGVGFLPRHRRIVKFANIRNGQVFNKPNKIEMQFSGIENAGMDEDYQLLIDGKYQASVYRGFTWHSPEPGTHTVEVVVRFGRLDGPEIGRSERITVHVQ